MEKEKVAVLFTGGRDSSLVACLESLKDKEVHLITCNSGIGIKSELSEIRFKELIERFPNNIVGRTILPTYGLFRSIAIKNLELDFKKWGINLVLLGDKLAIHAAATVYCLENGIKKIVDGCVGYQKDLAEQKNIAIELLKQFEAKYNINYECPIYNFGDQDDVKYALMKFGLSSKSLEGVSIFGDAFSEPTEQIVAEYIQDLELDFKKWGINLVLLGDKLAIHAAATVYCLENGIKKIVDGCVGYQKDLAEQKNIAIELLKQFEAKYNINYECPIYNFGDQDDVKYALMKFGLSSKSLEGVSIFGDAFSEPTEQIVAEYIQDKLSICEKHVDFMTNTRNIVENFSY